MPFPPPGYLLNIGQSKIISDKGSTASAGNVEARLGHTETLAETSFVIGSIKTIPNLDIVYIYPYKPLNSISCLFQSWEAQVLGFLASARLSHNTFFDLFIIFLRQNKIGKIESEKIKRSITVVITVPK